MKKWIAALLALAMCLALAACGGTETTTAPPATQAPAAEPDAAQEPEPTPEPEETTESSSATFDKIAVEIKDAYLTTDYEGNPAIAITYSWTNNSEDPNMALVAVSCYAYQGGIGLETAIIMNDPNYDSNLISTQIQPGATLDVQQAFVLRDETSPVEFEAEQFLNTSDTKAVKEFDLTELG